jgi:alpha-galactosidase
VTHPGEVVDEIPVDPAVGRVYAEGWQSWSPATWYPVTASGRQPQGVEEHLMRFRPGTPVREGGVQGEGLLVVDPGNGEPARLYGSTDPIDVPTLRASLVDDHVVVRATAAVSRSTHDDGGEAALAAFGSSYAATGEQKPRPRPPTVWCSWYRYFEQVTAVDVAENLTAFDAQDLRVDVVQVDDGWSPGLGEGLRPAPRFGDLAGLADSVRSSGRRLGLWLAPFVVGVRTTLARQHPEWLVGPAGHNWGQDLVGLDLTHPGVQDMLREALAYVVGLGADYLKLDFLYGGAVPGRRHTGSDPVAAYREGLALVRATVGPEVYLVGCGAPLLPSVALVDAMRVSPDTFHEGGEDGSRGLRGLMPLAARAWQQGRLWTNDPDCVVARPDYSQRERWARAAHDLGGLRSFSDRVADLDRWGVATVRTLLADGGTAEVLPPDRIRAAALLAMDEGSP